MRSRRPLACLHSCRFNANARPTAAAADATRPNAQAARRKKALEAQAASNGGFGTRVQLSEAALAALAAEGGMAWSKDAEGDATFSFYNIYRNGAPAEAVEQTADAAFSALAIWLSEQQAIVEKQFLMERDRLRRVYEAEKEARGGGACVLALLASECRVPCAASNQRPRTPR